jgi:hypothetical protein
VHTHPRASRRTRAVKLECLYLCSQVIVHDLGQCTRTHGCVHACANVQLYIFTRACVSNVCVCACLCTHTHTHARAPVLHKCVYNVLRLDRTAHQLTPSEYRTLCTSCICKDSYQTQWSTQNCFAHTHIVPFLPPEYSTCVRRVCVLVTKVHKCYPNPVLGHTRASLWPITGVRYAVSEADHAVYNPHAD